MQIEKSYHGHTRRMKLERPNGETGRQKCAVCAQTGLNVASLAGYISGSGHCAYHHAVRCWGKKWSDSLSIVNPEKRNRSGRATDMEG